MRSCLELGQGVGHRLFLLALCTTMVSAVGCFSPDRPTCAFRCGPDNVCPDDYSCGVDHRCHLLDDNGALRACEDQLPADAAGDAGAHDGAPLDTVAHDGAPADTAPVDAGSVDAGTLDGPVAILDGSPGGVDAAPGDAASPDAVAIDAAPIDAAPIDAAPIDALPIDASLCGDGTVQELYEDCDDGNAVDDGNGCDAACQRNDVCGDGAVQALYEDCDDENDVPGDGCTACAIDMGYACSGEPSVCVDRTFTMSIDGTREALWSAAGVTTDAGSVGQYRLPQDLVQTVYLTNDGDYLYVGVDGFTDPWDDSYPAFLHVYLTRDPTVSGAITADGAANTSITFAAGTHQPDGLGRFAWNRYSGDSVVSGMIEAGAASDGFVEVRIPLTSIGSPSVGDTIGLIVGARADSGETGLCDLAPYRPSVTSDYGSSPAPVDPGATDYIPFTLY